MTTRYPNTIKSSGKVQEAYKNDLLSLKCYFRKTVPKPQYPNVYDRMNAIWEIQDGVRILTKQISMDNSWVILHGLSYLLKPMVAIMRK